MDGGAGKGDKRRPRSSKCSADEFEKRWEMAFGKRDEKKEDEKENKESNN